MGVRFSLRTAPRADWRELARVHAPAYLESLTEPLSLSRVFGFDDDRFPVEATLDTVLTTVGAVVAAARAALETRGPVACLAAHPDDETLGCGGTLALLAARGLDVHVVVVADGGPDGCDGDSGFINADQSELDRRGDERDRIPDFASADHRNGVDGPGDPGEPAAGGRASAPDGRSARSV